METLTMIDARMGNRGAPLREWVNRELQQACSAR